MQQYNILINRYQQVLCGVAAFCRWIEVLFYYIIYIYIYYVILYWKECLFEWFESCFFISHIFSLLVGHTLLNSRAWWWYIDQFWEYPFTKIKVEERVYIMATMWKDWYEKSKWWYDQVGLLIILSGANCNAIQQDRSTTVVTLVDL